MEFWSEEGIVLQARPFGETGTVLHCLTRSYGNHAGLVHGGQSRRKAALLELGNQLNLNWSARISDNLGSYNCELVESRAALYLSDQPRLLALQAFCATLALLCPEREPMPFVYDAAQSWLSLLESAHWAQTLVRFELGLLTALGYHLELERCAVTNQEHDLCFVSPKSGRAVSRAVAQPYQERLLQLPAFLTQSSNALESDDEWKSQAAQGLKLTGYFLEKHLFSSLNRPLPEARWALYNLLTRNESPRNSAFI